MLKRYVLAPPIGRPFGDVNDQTLKAGRNTLKKPPDQCARHHIKLP
nr:MAG TPA: hypothetical protein [Caudoviricetes sp.]